MPHQNRRTQQSRGHESCPRCSTCQEGTVRTVMQTEARKLSYAFQLGKWILSCFPRDRNCRAGTAADEHCPLGKMSPLGMTHKQPHQPWNGTCQLRMEPEQLLHGGKNGPLDRDSQRQYRLAWDSKSLVGRRIQRHIPHLCGYLSAWRTALTTHRSGHLCTALQVLQHRSRDKMTLACKHGSQMQRNLLGCHEKYQVDIPAVCLGPFLQDSTVLASSHAEGGHQACKLCHLGKACTKQIPNQLCMYQQDKEWEPRFLLGMYG